MLQFMTGPRRHASGILTIPKLDYGNPKIMRFLSPHAGGNDSLVVEETPAKTSTWRLRSRRISRRDELIVVVDWSFTSSASAWVAELLANVLGRSACCGEQVFCRVRQ
ncbi:unnamed protein product [Ectocarpus sp. CCAP 1310/34]|nr:unnamed protein product [Ectocarpus sp. CCAP 1310/34]